LTAEDFERDRRLELERVRQLTSAISDDTDAPATAATSSTDTQHTLTTLDTVAATATTTDGSCLNCFNILWRLSCGGVIGWLLLHPW